MCRTLYHQPTSQSGRTQSLLPGLACPHSWVPAQWMRALVALFSIVRGFGLMPTVRRGALRAFSDPDHAVRYPFWSTAPPSPPSLLHVLQLGLPRPWGTGPHTSPPPSPRLPAPLHFSSLETKKGRLLKEFRLVSSDVALSQDKARGVLLVLRSRPNIVRPWGKRREGVPG